MQQPLVSVIIPLFNAEKHIGSAIESVINQNYKNIEVIIVDDGSNDASFAIAKSYERENIIVIKQENKGASAARNTGLKKAAGKYIQYLDADDLISTDKIQNQTKILEEGNGLLSCCSTVYFKDGENPFDKKPEPTWYQNYDGGDVKDFLTKLYGGALIGPEYGGVVTIHSWLCPKAILDEAGPWNEELSMDDDGEYFCRVILKSKGVSCANAINYYRKHKTNSNLSAQLSHKGYQSMLAASLLKYRHLTGIIEKELLNQIFIPHFQQITVATFPKYKEISNQAYQIAKNLGLQQVRYNAGPVTTLFAKLLGWKLARIINHIRYGV